MKLILLSLLFFFSSCANLINGYHQELDQGSNNRQKKFSAVKRDKFSHLRTGKQNVSSRSSKTLYPQVRRQYKSPQAPKTRIKAHHLNDNGNNASLWAGNHKHTNLFTDDRKITHGDIVLIQVMGDLKRDITLELKRVFPDAPKLSSKKKDAKKEGASEEKKPTKKDKDVATSANQVYDKISSVVIDEIRGNYLVLKGQKQLLFKNRKHTVEIQALVSRKEIDLSDSVKSTVIMEKTITVIN